MLKRRFLVVFVLLAVGLLCAFFFRGPARETKANEPEPAPAATVAPVKRATIQNVLRVAGQFIPYQEVDLHAKVSGYIKSINVDIGDRVRVGQVIARLEVPELNAQLVGAQAQVRHSESEINRAKSEVSRAIANHAAIHAAYERLLQVSKQRSGLIAQQELDDAQARDQNSEAQIEAARAALEAQEQQLGVSKADNLRVQTLADYSVVVSPFDGVVTRRYADTGSLIQAGTASNTQAMPVVRVAQSNVLRLRMPVPESDVRFVQAGATVKVSVGALGLDFRGQVVRFARALDTATRTMIAEVDVKNPDLKLNPGMYAETEIVLQQRNNVPCLPTQAIQKDGKQNYVLMVDGEKKVEKRNVQVGIDGEGMTELKGGLSDGDLVILSGQNNYQVGEVVRPEITAPADEKEEADK
jgi:RND family efflux transporter MFP subunit